MEGKIVNTKEINSIKSNQRRRKNPKTLGLFLLQKDFKVFTVNFEISLGFLF